MHKCANLCLGELMCVKVLFSLLGIGSNVFLGNVCICPGYLWMS